MNSRFIYITYAALGGIGVLFPVFAMAQQFGGSDPTFASLVSDFIGIIDLLIPVVIGLAFVLFLWGVADWILNLESEDKRKQARDFMIYGVVILFIMVSIFGILEILTNTFFNGGGGGTDTDTPFTEPLDAA